MRFLFLGIVALTFLFANLQKEVSIEITKVDLGKNQVEFAAGDLRIGESGWIKVDFHNYTGIIKQVVVIAIDKKNAIGKMVDFDTLKQKYLPRPTNKVKVGDKVYFRTLNTKAFLVAPDLESYEKVKNTHKEVEFLSPDLLMGFLLAYGGYDPTKEFFKKACGSYAVGLLYVVNENALDILDCQSTISLKTEDFDTSGIKEPKTPFYSRIDEIKTGTLFSFMQSKKAKYYFPYFTNFAHPERDYQTMMVKEKREIDAKLQAQKEEEKRLKLEKKKNKEK
ncbi:plasminogen-binding N-terminal domain-containing protein [Helicobacter anatolicus]|uniref:plasminogen-binding N-terminal domain-containing protein n=1 Tax=Helicobacter anatolicus TaxID=2905874 RepID=UPI001E635714|nr:plasminogen-binding N-terminal domain-containing protein [Helicobacter anatolicus]MCE3039632.1 plasminogen-binding N-terminal domain-containing protein [Helicobacter anatolicus]